MPAGIRNEGTIFGETGRKVGESREKQTEEMTAGGFGIRYVSRLVCFGAYPCLYIIFCKRIWVVFHKFFCDRQYVPEKRSICAVGCPGGAVFLFQPEADHPENAGKGERKFSGTGGCGIAAVCDHYTVSSPGISAESGAAYCVCHVSFRLSCDRYCLSVLADEAVCPGKGK